MDIAEELKKKRRDRRMSAEKLAKFLRTKTSNIYKWENGALPKDPELYGRLKNWINSDLDTNEDIDSSVAEEDAPYITQENKKELSLLAIIKLTDSNAELAKANRTLADAHYVIAKNQEYLVDRLKATERADSEIPITVAAKFSEVLELIALVGSGQKRWKSVQEARAELNKHVLAPRKKAS